MSSATIRGSARVVNNLIDNARSFSPPGGEVRVTLRRDRSEGAVEVIVDDDGPGIPPHALERIFERFYTDRPTRASARIPASACPSRARSSRRIVPDPRPQSHGAGRRRRARFIMRLPVPK